MPWPRSTSCVPERCEPPNVSVDKATYARKISSPGLKHTSKVIKGGHRRPSLIQFLLTNHLLSLSNKDISNLPRQNEPTLQRHCPHPSPGRPSGRVYGQPGAKPTARDRRQQLRHCLIEIIVSLCLRPSCTATTRTDRLQLYQKRPSVHSPSLSRSVLSSTLILLMLGSRFVQPHKTVSMHVHLSSVSTIDMAARSVWIQNLFHFFISVVIV